MSFSNEGRDVTQTLDFRGIIEYVIELTNFFKKK
jgi:hypothetical protein